MQLVTVLHWACYGLVALIEWLILAGLAPNESTNTFRSLPSFKLQICCFPFFLPQYLLFMISHKVVLQGMDVVVGIGVVVGAGVEGRLPQLLPLTCHLCAILGQEGSIFPLGNMQSSLRLLLHVPRGICSIRKTIQSKSVMHLQHLLLDLYNNEGAFLAGYSINI